jgi:CheY-like chemotaxis protein
VPVAEGSKTTVLLIDDDPSHLKLYSLILGRQGYRVVTSLVGMKSVDFPRGGGDVNLVVMDYRLNSVLTGPDVARLVREKFPGTPIMLLSEYQWMPDDMAGRVDAFVTKGNPDVLQERVAELAPPQG